MFIDATSLHYRELNELIRMAIKDGAREILIKNVNGQRYIAAGLKGDVYLEIDGVPGNDLAVFMDGPEIIVRNNAQDGIGNTMNSGTVVVHGHGGDVIGYGMRGGRIFIMGDTGYRTGIHMKGYMDKQPVIIIGGRAGDFCGEYMAGGMMILLDLEEKGDITGDYLGTGMHGGVIFIRGDVSRRRCGAEVGIVEPDDKDMIMIKRHIEDFCKYFNINIEEVFSKPFKKLLPVSSRPYGNLYCY